MIELNVLSGNTIGLDVNDSSLIPLDVMIGGSGGITPSGTKSISITANGTYTEDVTVYANAEIDVNVSGGITPSGTKNISITANGTTTEDVTNYANAQITANVPNTYTVADEGKVVDDGALVSQTSKSITANGTHDTTTNNSVTVAVANSYTASDEGKVVDNGALVSQTSATYTANDTYDTTLINEVIVNVSGGSGADPLDFSGGNILAIKGHGTEYIITDIYPNFVGVYATKFSDDSITNYEHYWSALGTSTGYLGLQRNGTSQNISVKAMGVTVNNVTYTGFSNGNVITPVFSNIGLSEPSQKQKPLAFWRGYYNGNLESQIATYTFYGLNILNSNFEYTYRFVPWLDNGVACIKELISGTIYHNSGTGAYDYIDLEGVTHNA